MQGNVVPFEQLADADLQVDTIYKAGSKPNMRSEVLSKLMPGCMNASGFRKVKKKEGGELPAYVVLYGYCGNIEALFNY